MSIECRSNKHKRSVRTLMSIDILVPIVFGGEGLSSCLSCTSWPSCFRQQKMCAGPIKVLSDLVILFSADAIDIQVLSDLEPLFGPAVAWRALVFLARCKGLEDLNVYRT